MPLNFIAKMKENAAKAECPPVLCIPGPISEETKKALEKAHAQGKGVVVVEKSQPPFAVMPKIETVYNSPEHTLNYAKAKWSPEQQIKTAFALLSMAGVKAKSAQVQHQTQYSDFDIMGHTGHQHMITDVEHIAEIDFILTNEKGNLHQLAVLLNEHVNGSKIF